jgi:hypothetical protein
MNGLRELKNLFNKYALESGQVINSAKSTIFSRSITPRRLALMVQLLNFSLGSLPFNYLGVPIFKGKPRVIHLQPIADRVKLKLSAWKASLLSIAGRVQLVRSVVQSMLIYSISIYSWPESLLKDIEKSMRNFIWSGDIEKRKLVTVSWKNLCKPFHKGGLSIRSLSKLNKAANLKLCWSLMNSQSSWARLLKDRVFRNNRPIQHHIFSSIWSSVKEEVGEMLQNSIWTIGNGENINFWNDNWCGIPLSDFFNIPAHTRPLLTSKVSDYLVDGIWSLPLQLTQAYNNLNYIVNQAVIPLEPAQAQDQILWKPSATGDLSLKAAYLFKMHYSQDLDWAKLIWSVAIPPSKSLLVWRLMYDKLPTDEKLLIRGCHLHSMCSICKNQVDSTFHVFF